MNENSFIGKGLGLISTLGWQIIAVAFFINVIGLVNLYSSVAITIGVGVFFKQVAWVILGMFSMFFLGLLSGRIIKKISPIVYVISIILLIVVFVKGVYISGSRRWLSLLFFRFQPSELAKLSLVMMLSWIISRKKIPGGFDLKRLIVPGITIIIPFILILIEPDLGTASVVAMIGMGMLLIHGIKKKTLIFIFIITLIAGLGIYKWGLKGYQRKRIETFLKSSNDILGAGYHARQSKIAVGSGRLFGNGFMQGTQTQLRFLPEQYTDFAFSVFAEEWGFVGCVVLIGLFVILMGSIIQVALLQEDIFGFMLCIGILFMFFIHFMVNISMTIGLVPVVGIPLPFISYGGTTTMTHFIGLGLVLNADYNRLIYRR